jgi:hypothetical protein
MILDSVMLCPRGLLLVFDGVDLLFLESAFPVAIPQRLPGDLLFHLRQSCE